MFDAVMSLSSYALGHLTLFAVEAIVLMMELFRPTCTDARLWTILLLAAAVNDNFLIGAGTLLPEGPLVLLSYIRWWAHWALVPFLIVAATRVAHGSGAKWASFPLVMPVAYAASIALSIFDVREGFLDEGGLQLEPAEFAGTLRLVSASEVGPPFVTIGVNVYVLLVAVGLWFRCKHRELFVGSFLAFVGNGIPMSLAGTLPGSLGEAALILSLLDAELLFRPLPSSEEERQPLMR